MINHQSLKRSDVAIMACATALIVANLYYCQPLIILIAEEFGVADSVAGRTIYLTQIGYAIGLFLLVPLGDMFERKKQILIITAGAVIFLITAALSPTFFALQVACVGIGFGSIVPQLILPMAANLSAPKQRGQVVGIVMSGLLIGILLSRTLSGFIGSLFGWRSMYWIAASICSALLLLIYYRFPKSEANFTGSYRQLLQSLLTLLKQQKILRESSLINYLVFAIFGCFWTSMVLFLANEPYNYESQTIGLFGLAGATGALMAPIIGKISDKGNPRLAVGYGLVLLLISQVMFYYLGYQVLFFILSIIVLEAGQQAVHVSNQTRVYALDANARNRLNTIFMTASFIGAASGSALGLFLWSMGGWAAVCIGSGGITILGLGVYFLTGKRGSYSSST